MQKLTASVTSFVQAHVSQATTGYILLFTIAFLLFWEAFVIAFKIPQATISEIVWKTLRQFPQVGFALCFLLGHFLWQSRAAWSKADFEPANKESE